MSTPTAPTIEQLKTRLAVMDSHYRESMFHGRDWPVLGKRAHDSEVDAIRSVLLSHAEVVKERDQLKGLNTILNGQRRDDMREIGDLKAEVGRIREAYVWSKEGEDKAIKLSLELKARAEKAEADAKQWHQEADRRLKELGDKQEELDKAEAALAEQAPLVEAVMPKDDGDAPFPDWTNRLINAALALRASRQLKTEGDKQ